MIKVEKKIKVTLRNVETATGGNILSTKKLSQLPIIKKLQYVKLVYLIPFDRDSLHPAAVSLMDSLYPEIEPFFCSLKTWMMNLLIDSKEKCLE